MKEKVKIASRNDYLRVNTANFLENEKKYAELTRDPIRQNLLSDQNYYQNLNKMFHENTNVFLTNEQKYHNAQNENDAKLKLRQNLTQKRIGSHTPGVVVQEHIIREYITTKDNTLPRQGSEEVLKLRGSHEKLPGEAKSYVRSGKNRESYEIAQKINPFFENPNFVLKETDKFLTDVQDYSHKQNEEFAKNPAVKSPKGKSKSRDNLFDNIKTKTAKLFRSTSNPKGDKAKKARQQFEETKNATQNFLNDHQNFSHSQNEEFTIFTNKSKSPNTPKPELGTLKNGITYEKVIPTGSEKDSKSTTQEKEDIVTKTENKKVGNKEIVTRTEITTQTTRNISSEESVKKFTVNVKNQQELEDIINNIFDDNVMTGQADVLDFGAPKTPTTPRTPTTPKSTTSTAPKSPSEPKTSTTLKSSTSPNSSTTLTTSTTTKTPSKIAPQLSKTDEPHLYQNVWGNSKAPDSDEHAYENVKFSPPSTTNPSDKSNTKENIFYEFMSTNNINFLNDLQSYTNYQNEEFVKFKQSHPEMYKNKSKNEGILKKIKTQTSKLFHSDKDKTPKSKKVKTNTASPVGSVKKPDVELSHEFLHNITTNFLDQEKLFRKKEEQGSRSFFAKNPNLEPYTKHPNLRTNEVIPKNEKYANEAFLKNETHNFLVDHISHHNLERKEYLDYRTKNPKWTPEKKSKNLFGTLKSKANKMFKSSENLIEPDVEAKKVKTVKARNKSVDENELLRKQTKEFLSNQKQYSDSEKAQFLAFTQKNPELSPTSQEKQKKNLFGTLKSKTGKLFKSKENISTTTSDGMSTLKRKAAHEKFLKDQEDLNNFMHYQKVYHNFERKEHWDFLRRQADLEKEQVKEPVSKTEATKQKAAAVPAPNQYENYYFLKFQTEELIRDQKAHHDEERKEFLAFLQKHPEWCSFPKKHQSIFGKIKTKAGSLLKHSSKDNVNEPEAPVRKSKVVATEAASPKKGSPYESDDFLKKQTIAFLKDAKNHSDAERKEYLDFIEKHPKWSPTSKKQQSLLGILKSKADNLLKSKDEPKVEKAEKSKPLAAARSPQKENPYESYQFLKNQTEALIKDQKAHHNEERKEFLAFVQKHPEWSPTPKKHHGVLCKLKSKTGNLLKHSSKDNLTEPEVPVRKSKVATAAGTPKKGSPYEDDDFLKKQTIAFIKDAKKHSNVERKEYLDFVAKHPNWSPTPKKQQSIFGKLKSKADNLLKSKDEPKVEKAEKSKPLAASQTSQKENPYESYGFLKNQTEALIRDQKAHHDEERKEFLAFLQKHPEWCSSPKKHQSLFGKIKTKAGSLLKHSSKDNVNEPESPVRKTKVATAADSPKKLSLYENDDFLKKQTIAFLKDAKNHSNAERKEYLDFIEKHPKWSPTSKKQQSLLGKLKSKADNLLKSKDEPKLEKAEKSKPLAVSRSPQKENPYESYQFLKNQTEALIKDQKAHHNEERKEFLAFVQKHPEWSPTPKKHHGVLCKLKSKTENLLKHSSKDNLTEPEVPVRKSKVATAAGTPKKGSPYEDEDSLKKQTIAFIKDAKNHSDIERKEYLDFLAKHPQWSPSPKKHQSVFGKIKNILKSPKDSSKEAEVKAKKTKGTSATPSEGSPYENPEFLKNATGEFLQKQKYSHDQERKEYNDYKARNPDWKPYAQKRLIPTAKSVQERKKIISLPQDIYKDYIFLHDQTALFLDEQKTHSDHYWLEVQDHNKKHPQKLIPKAKKGLLETVKAKILKPQEHESKNKKIKPSLEEDPYKNPAFLCGHTEEFLREQKLHDDVQKTEYMKFKARSPIQGVKKQNKVTFGDVKHNAPSRATQQLQETHFGREPVPKNKTEVQETHFSSEPVQKVKTQLLTQPEGAKPVHETHFDAEPIQKHPEHLKTVQETHFSGEPVQKIKAQMLPSPDHVKDSKKEQLIFLGNINLRDLTALKMLTVMFLENERSVGNENMILSAKYKTSHPQWFAPTKEHKKIINVIKSKAEKLFSHKDKPSTVKDDDKYKNLEFLRKENKTFLDDIKKYHDTERLGVNTFEKSNPQLVKTWRKTTPTVQEPQVKKSMKEKILGSIKGSPKSKSEHEQFEKLLKDTRTFVDAEKSYANHEKEGLINFMSNQVLHTDLHSQKTKKPDVVPKVSRQQTFEFLQYEKDWANMVKMENLLNDANNKKTPSKTAEKNVKPLEKGAKTSLKSKVSSTIKKITPTPTKTSERRASLEKNKSPLEKKPPKPKETLIKIEVEQKPRGRIFTPPPQKQKSPTKLEGPKKFELKRPSSLVEKRKSSDITLTSKNKAHSKDDQKTGVAAKVENNLLKNKYYSEKNIRTETHEETVENFSTRTNKKEIVIGKTPEISKSVESLLDNNNLRPSTRFVTTCYIKPERRPVWFSESLLVDMDSKEKKFDEKVQYDNKLQPHFWSETMTTNVFSRTETYKSEKVVTVEETARYISLEDLHKSK